MANALVVIAVFILWALGDIFADSYFTARPERRSSASTEAQVNRGRNQRAPQ